MKKGLFLSLIMAVAISVTACGSSKDQYAASTEEVAWDSSYDMMAVEAPAAPMESASSFSEATTVDVAAADQKIITTYNYDVETKDYDTLLADLTGKISEYGGYVESSNEWNRGDRYRACNFTIRIPQQRMSEFLGDVEANANVLSKSTDTENVTLQYVDLESHITALKTEETTLLRLMEQAEKLEDVLTIQHELTEVRYQLQSYESQRRSLENRVSYDTLYLNISEVERETAVVKNPGFWEEVSKGFKENVYELVEGIKGFLIWFLSNIVTIVFWIVLIFIAVKVIKWFCGDKGEKANKKGFFHRKKTEQKDEVE